jgi:ferredoxin-NADP reductase/nitroimidazol reductase NimA-like FMN-containing flavoprotein (pyridoxamine 5'-phosphate oxidase superfamily)
MSESFETTDRSRVRLFGARGNYRKHAVYEMIDSSLYGTVAYNVDGLPYATPTMLWRQGDYIYWHGSAGSRMLKTVAQGAPVCVTFVHVDGFVLSRLASAHAMNYRSAMVFGSPEPVESLAERRHQLQFFLNRLFPGRWSEVKQPTEAELNGIIMVRMKVEEGSLKRRAGAPGDGRPVFGGETLFEQECWAGVLPIQTHIGRGEAGPRLKANLVVPDYLGSFADRFGYALAPDADATQATAVRVVSSRDLTPLIRLFRLEPVGEARFAVPESGAHISLQVTAGDGTVDFREYTITNWDANGAWYEIAVLREDSGRGGSRHMHAYASPGSTLPLKMVRNDFVLDEAADRYILVAGGIGVTPIVAMARRLRSLGKPFDLHYSFRGQASAAFLDDLRDLVGSHLHLHDTSKPGARIDLQSVILAGETAHIYACGPQNLLEAIDARAAEAGLDPAQIHRELFKVPAAVTTDLPIEVELKRSQLKFMASPGRSIMDQVHDLGVSTPHSCKRGECGLCATGVVGGTPIHRDNFLKPAEKDRNDRLCICVSWAQSDGLVLDL